MAFHEVRFPASLSFGSAGGPERKTEIVTLTNGFEERNSPWAHSRRRFDAGMGLRSMDDVAALIAFFEARHGQLHGFRWKDWSDYKSCLPSKAPSPLDQDIGRGDGVRTVFQLTKTYQSGAQRYERTVTKPAAGTVLVAVAGDPKAASLEFEVSANTGLITFRDAPPVGVEVTAGYEFDVPVRFDADSIQVSVETFQAGQMPAVPVVEVRIA